MIVQGVAGCFSCMKSSAGAATTNHTVGIVISSVSWKQNVRSGTPFVSHDRLWFWKTNQESELIMFPSLVCSSLEFIPIHPVKIQLTAHPKRIFTEKRIILDCHFQEVAVFELRKMAFF